MRSDRDERGERGKKKISVRFPDTLPLGPQPAERFTRGAMRWYWTSLMDGPMLIRLLADGGGSSGRGQPAASPPFPAPPQTWRMAAGFGLQANGATPPLPLGRQPPLLDPGARQRVFRPTCSSIAPAPPLRAATGGLRYFLLPDLLSTAIPLSSEGSLTACPSFLPGFGHQCNAVRIYGKKEAGTGEHLNTFNQINKHNRNAAAPRGRLPHTKHKVKSRPGPLSSSNVVTPPFIPSEAPPWDSRPVSGAGVVHYHSLHRPRSVPTALGPAPLVTVTLQMLFENMPRVAHTPH